MALADERSMLCPLCGKRFDSSEMIRGEMVRAPIAALIQKTHPDWSAQQQICRQDLNQYRMQYVREALELEKKELVNLESNVLESQKTQMCLSKNINIEFEKQLSLGERIADAVAAFGGSWKFIISFTGGMLVWIAINSLLLLRQPFDPYPYILLNLVLSCLSSLQGPVILMSQNRQDAKDRLRSEYDYRVNLQAELEIRQLNAKMDLLLSRQWQRLMEIQEMQLELMQEYPVGK